MLKMYEGEVLSKLPVMQVGEEERGAALYCTHYSGNGTLVSGVTTYMYTVLHTAH